MVLPRQQIDEPRLQPESEQAQAWRPEREGGSLGRVARLRAEEVDLDLPRRAHLAIRRRPDAKPEQRVVRGHLRAPVRGGVAPGARERRVVRGRAVALRAVVHGVQLDEAVDAGGPAASHVDGRLSRDGRRCRRLALAPALSRKRERGNGSLARRRGERGDGSGSLAPRNGERVRERGSGVLRGGQARGQQHGQPREASHFFLCSSASTPAATTSMMRSTS